MARYVYKTRPFVHQVRALKKLLRNEWGGALLMAPRTGKTKVAIDWLAINFQLRKINRVLIVCPKFVMDVWEEQLAEHCPVPYEVYFWDQKERRNGGIPPPGKQRLLVVITNYEAFGTPGPKIYTGKFDEDGNALYRRSTKKGRIANRNEVRRWCAGGKVAGILDESHRIKSAGAAAARTVITTHGSFPYRLIATGTPITKKARPHDAYQQWKWLNPERFDEFENLEDFKNYFGRWVKVDKIPVPLFKGSKHFDELKELMEMDAFSIDRDQCFDMPPDDVHIIPVKLSRSARVYDDMAERMVSYVRQHTAEASIPLVKVLRLAQIAGGHVTTDRGETIVVGTEKIDATMDLMRECIEHGERVVIAARFRPELDLLYDRIRKLNRRLPIFEIRGGMKREEVTVGLRKARKITDNPLVYIVQPRAASLGIDMSFCSRMVWYSLGNSYVDYTQCCDRIALAPFRTFTYMLTDGIDRLLYEELQQDGQIARAVIRNPERLFRHAD
jgi:SNF2-related domain/Helicase conserved C-terminal domain